MYYDLLGFLQALIGTYTPQTYDVDWSYVDSTDVIIDGYYTVIPDGVSGLDIEYIVMAIILLGILKIFKDVMFNAVKYMNGK